MIRPSIWTSKSVLAARQKERAMPHQWFPDRRRLRTRTARRSLIPASIRTNTRQQKLLTGSNASSDPRIVRALFSKCEQSQAGGHDPSGSIGEPGPAVSRRRKILGPPMSAMRSLCKSEDSRPALSSSHRMPAMESPILIDGPRRNKGKAVTNVLFETFGLGAHPPSERCR